jgi:hypothetical protein
LTWIPAKPQGFNVRISRKSDAKWSKSKKPKSALSCGWQRDELYFQQDEQFYF